MIIIMIPMIIIMMIMILMTMTMMILMIILQCIEGEWHVEQPCLAFETLH